MKMRVGHVIGGGGAIRKWKIDKSWYACKKISLVNTPETFRKEAEMALRTRRLSHVAKVEKAFVKDNKGYLVMELCRTDLRDYMIEKAMLSGAEAARIFFQICQTVQKLHDIGIVHLDLTLENILIGFDGEIKLIDFGSAMVVKGEDKKIIQKKGGMVGYNSPEVNKNTPVNPKKADVWSLGVILHLMMTGSFPNSVVGKRRRFSWGKSLSNLLDRMLHPDQEQRCTLAEVLSHPWLVANSRTKSDSKKKALTKILLNK